MKPARRTQEVLIGGFIVIALLLIAQDVSTHRLHHIQEAHSFAIQRDSIVSIEQLGRVIRDVERERILLDDHVFAETPTQMAPVETGIAANRRDLRNAAETYRQYVELPSEAGLWTRAQALIIAFQDQSEKILGLSRQNRDLEARSMMLALQPVYEELEGVLDQLVQVNRAGAMDAAAAVEAASAFDDRLALGVTVVLFALFALLARWVFRNVLWYEHRLKETAAELALRNQDLDAFAARVAHDVRNALAPLTFLSGILRRVAENPALVHSTTARMEQAVRKAAGLVEALLAFSRGSREPKADERGAVVPVLKTVLQEVEPTATRIDVSISADALAQAEVRCSPDLLHIIVANVVGNAVKYLQGRRLRRVSISGRIVGGFYALSIADTGPGIPARDLERIFDPFYRVEGATAPGTGIGLATVRRILEAHHGHIEVQSRLGEGSVFQVWLPLAGESVAPGPVPPDTAAPSPFH
jgi:signal transduction histidine kinase